MLTGTRGLYGPNGVINNGGSSNVILKPGTTFGGGGTQGPVGPTGADGLSAYQVAVANGFVGTQQQWLASLADGVGTPGATGATGATGPAGQGGESGSVTITITCDGTTCTVNGP